MNTIIKTFDYAIEVQFGFVSFKPKNMFIYKLTQWQDQNIINKLKFSKF